MKTSHFFVFSILLAACSSKASVDSGDAGTHDAATQHQDAQTSSDLDAETADASNTPDSSADAAIIATDGSLTDATALDGASSTPDAGGDAGSMCDYIDLNYFILVCGTEYEYGADWVNVEGTSDACPQYTMFRGNEYDSAQKAADENEDCDNACVYRASTSVSIIRCGHRSGYIIYRASECPDLYETPDGIYHSTDEWNTAHPCSGTSDPMPGMPGSS